MPAHSLTFSPSAFARTKLVLMGPPGAMQRQVSDLARSLKETECVTVDELFRDEIARRTPAGLACSRALAAGSPVPDEVATSIVRRWFWSRKSSRGFVLMGFPANVAQAVVFDEWLDSRDEALTACVWLDQSHESASEEAQSDRAREDVRRWFARAEGDAKKVANHYRENGLLLSIDAERPLEDAMAEFADLVSPFVADR